MLTVFFSSVLLGFIFNAAPGPILAATIRFGLHGGFRPALSVQLGSLAGDALWAVLGLAGVGALLQIEALRTPLGVAGVLYLLWLAFDAWRDVDRTNADQRDADGISSPSEPVNRAFRSGILLSVTNPQNIAYWAAIGSALGSLGVSEPMPIHYAVFFAGFMASSILWSFICAALVDKLFSRAGRRWISLTTRSCAIAFVVLAVLSARQLWTLDPVPQTNGNELLIQNN